MIYETDFQRYADFVSELTAGIFGHSEPRIKECLKNTLDNVGFHLGATTSYEERYASYLCGRFSIDQLRFANSGTEANIHALAAARKFTGRRKIVVFRGGYHGSVLSFGMGMAGNNIDKDDFLIGQYNSISSISDIFAAHGPDIAAVILEGIQGSGGAICGTTEFLAAVRELSTSCGAVFVLDEVITSRLSPGGLGALLNVTPDMITLGKYLGGGMPFGAFGGRKEIMAVYDPRGAHPLGHSGTFQNNALMTNSGYVAMSQVYAPDIVGPFNARGDIFRARLQAIFAGSRLCVTGQGSLLCIHATKTGLTADQITCKDNVAAVEDVNLKKLLWLELINAGFWVTLRGSIALNLPLPDAVLESFVAAVGELCRRYSDLIAV